MSRSPRLTVRDAITHISRLSLPVTVTYTHDGHVRFRFFDVPTNRTRTLTVANGRPTQLVPPVLARVIATALSSPPLPPPPPPPPPSTPSLASSGFAAAPLARGAAAPQPPLHRLFAALAHLRKEHR